MPRKIDGIEYEIHPRPTKGEDSKPPLPLLARTFSFFQRISSLKNPFPCVFFVFFIQHWIILRIFALLPKFI